MRLTLTLPLLLGLIFATPLRADAFPATSQSELSSPMYWVNRADAESAWNSQEQYSIYGELAKEFASAGDGPHAREMLRRMKAVEPSVTDPVYRGIMSAVTTQTYARLGDTVAMREVLQAALSEVVRAEDLLHRAPSEQEALKVPRSVSRHELVRNLVEAKQYAEALRIARGAPSVDTRSNLLQSLAVAQAKDGRNSDYQATMKLVESETSAATQQARTPQDRDYSLWCLSQTQINAGDLDRATTSCAALKPNERIGILCQVATRRLKSGDSRRYAQAIDQAIQIAPGIKSQIDALSAYQSIARALARARDEARIGRVKQSAGEYGRWFAGELGFEQATICGEAGDVHGAKVALKPALDAADKDDEWEKATRFAVIQHWHVVEALAKASKDDAAIEVAGLRPSTISMDEVFSSVAIAQAERGDFATATSTFKRISDPKMRQSRAILLAYAAGKTGKQLDQVLRWIEGLSTPRTRADAFSNVASGLLSRH